MQQSAQKNIFFLEDLSQIPSLSLTEPPVPAAPAITTTTPAPSTGNSNETTTTASSGGGQPATTTTPGPPDGLQRRKRSTGSDVASYNSQTVGPVNVTSYKKLNVFEVTATFNCAADKVRFLFLRICCWLLNWESTAVLQQAHLLRATTRHCAQL